MYHNFVNRPPNWQNFFHWGRVTHIIVSKLTSIGSDNGLLPGRRKAIIWTSDALLLTKPLGRNVNEILIKIQHFSFKKYIWKDRLQKGIHFVQGKMS